jgi:hypothetical protein
LIIIDKETPQKIPTVTKKEKLEIQILKGMPMRKTRGNKGKRTVSKAEYPPLKDEMEQSLTPNPVFPELPELCVGEPISTSFEPAKKNNVKLPSPKIHKFQRKSKKPKISIDLNRPTTRG